MTQPWDFATLVENQSAAMQAAADRPLSLAVGKTVRAWIEAQAGVGLFLQGLAIQAIALALFATRYGTDADAWGAQFGFARLLATTASGLVTFARYTPTGAGIVPVGTLIETADGTQEFSVYAEPTNPNFNPTMGAEGSYVVAAGTATMDVPVRALGPGTQGNVLSGTITLILAQLTGIDTVNNAAALVNGLDAETDTAYKARFPLFLAGLARANRAAIVSAIIGVQQGLSYFVVENETVYGSAYFFINENYSDTPGTFAYPTLLAAPGKFFAVIDDGSGNPPPALLARISQAINAVRGFTISYQVYAPVLLQGNIAFRIIAQPGYSHAALANAAQAAVATYRDSLPLGTQILPLTRIAQVVYDAVPGVANVVDGTITINGAPSDLALNFMQMVRGGTITVS